MSTALRTRFEDYASAILTALRHADRERPARQYLQGLLLPGGRKSVEPMAARIAPERVRQTHQSMHHLVADAAWSDAALLGAVAEHVLPALAPAGEPVYWIIDDTGFPKKGRHSVGVTRQYCGQTGKRDNCQVAVSLSLASDAGSLPVGWRLYLPRDWAADPARRQRCGIPDEVAFATKPALALEQIQAALAAGYPRGTVLADAAYGDETAWREDIERLGLRYAVAVRPATTVWWGEHQPLPPGRGKRLRRDAEHQPLTVEELARQLPARQWRQIAWRQGSAEPLASRFARVHVQAAHRNQPRASQWLIIEWPEDEEQPAHYWLSNLPQNTTWAVMAKTVMARWRIERDYQEPGQELGLGHYEGRGWRGFHHHASLCIAAYGFLMRERLSNTKKNAAGRAALAVPEDTSERAAAARPAPCGRLDCHAALAVGRHARPGVAALPVLRAME